MSLSERGRRWGCCLLPRRRGGAAASRRGAVNLECPRSDKSLRVKDARLCLEALLLSPRSQLGTEARHSFRAVIDVPQCVLRWGLAAWRIL
jgi:hypothetical protein